MRRVVGLATASSLILGMLGLTAQPAQAVAAISVKPTSGPPGTLVEVTGTGFYDPCEVRFGGESGDLVGTCDAVPDLNGSILVTFNVPDVKPGQYAIWFCSGCDGEFEEIDTATFTVTPPTTTTTPSPTTTSPGPPTTTSSGPPTTTGPGPITSSPGTTVPGSTTTTAPASAPVELISGSAIPDMGPGSPFADAIGDFWRPFGFRDGRMRLPSVWLLRCGAPPGSEWVGFDDQPLGASPRLTMPDDPSQVFIHARATRVVAPAQGTSTAPHAMGFSARPSPTTAFDSNAAFFSSDTRFTYLGLNVGLNDDIEGPVTIELASRRVAGGWSDIDRVELGPERSPASTCLMVQPPEGETFREAHLRVYSPTGDPVNLIVDDFYWSHTDRYPIEPNPQLVDMEIIFPTAAIRLNTARNMAVFGRMSWPAGLTVSDVQIATPNWDSSGVVSRRAARGNTTTEGLVSSAYFWLDGIEVPSGPFQLSATAIGPNLRGGVTSNLEGHGLPSPPDTEYADLVAGQVDIIPWAMEVTQAVRGPLTVQRPGSIMVDPFPHIAGKRTVVRGYAVHEIPASLGVRPGQLMGEALLHGTSGGVTLPFSPLRPESTPTRIFAGTEAQSLTRQYASNSFNFTLPYTWTTGDEIQLRLEVNPPGSSLHIEEIDGGGGWNNTIAQLVDFNDVGRVGVSAVSVELHWRCTEEMIETDDAGHPCFGAAVGDAVSDGTTADQIRAAIRDWWKVMPAPGDFPAYLTISEIEIPHKSDDPRVSVDRTITGRAATVEWETWRNAYWDLYCTGGDVRNPTQIRPPSVRDFVWMTQPRYSPFRNGGCAWINQRSAFRGNTRWSTPAQEAGHTVGMEHTGNAHGELDGGSAVIRFPGDHGQIDPPRDRAWGFDTDAMTAINPGSGHVHDYMSYGGWPVWTSIGTWNHMYRALLFNRSIGEDRGEVISGSGASETAGAPGEGEALIVEGTVDADGGVSISSPYLGDANALFILEGDDVRVTLETATGATLIESVALAQANTHDTSDFKAFALIFPSDFEPISMVIDVDGSDSTEVTGGEGPTLTILDVATDRIRWDPGAAAPPFKVEASDDGGLSWWVLGITEERELVFDPAVSPLVGAGWTVRIQGADGPRVLIDQAPIDFGIPPPVASIGDPLDGQRVPVGMVQVYAAVGVIGDEGATYAWSVGGLPVNEGQISDIPVLPGENRVTLTVENESGSDEHSITLVGVFDTDGDGLDDQWEEEHGFDPLVADLVEEDADGDLLSLAHEYQVGTDPNEVDTDGDGYSDGLELFGAGDPLDPLSSPGPVHGADDHLLASAGPDVEAPELPVWILLVLGASSVGAVAYWLGRRRASRSSR